MQSKVISIVVVLASLIAYVVSDYEQTCNALSYSSRPSRYLTTCGTRLTTTIYRLCRSIHLRKRSITIDENEANTLFRVKREYRSEVGIVCECCVHRCTNRELTQYCSTTRDGRRRRSISSSSPAVFSEQDVDEIYEEIDRETQQSTPYLFTKSELNKIQQLEATKRANIDQKQHFSSVNKDLTAVERSEPHQSGTTTTQRIVDAPVSHLDSRNSIDKIKIRTIISTLVNLRHHKNKQARSRAS